MVVDDTLPIFPGCPTFGYTMQPDYLVKIVAREGGFERRDLKWNTPLHRYATVPLGNQDQVDIEQAVAFWHAVGGRAMAFRFMDWADYTSGSLGESSNPLVTPFDQPLDVAPLSPNEYQMVKVYWAGSLSRTRPIFKPIGATVKVANEFGAEQSPSTWVVNEGDGTIIPIGGFTGIPATWGGKFYVQVRFDSDLVVNLSEHLIQSVSFVLQEVRQVPS
jgi:uncharacterized protein (TIGR02217 family)